MTEIKVIADVSRYTGDWNVDREDGEVYILINGKLNTLKYTLHNNKTLLHLMATNREKSEHSDLYLEIAKFLIKEKREGYVNSSDNYGQTPLHVAATYGDLDMIMLLVSNDGDVTMKNDSNSTPIDNNQYRMNDKLYGLSNSKRNIDPNDQTISNILEIGKLRVESMRRELDERLMPLEGLNFTEMKRSLKRREPIHQTLAFSSLLNSRLAEDSISGVNGLPIEVFDMIAKSLKEEQNTKRGGKVSQRNKSRSRRTNRKRNNRKRNNRKRTNKKRTNKKRTNKKRTNRKLK